MNKFGMLALTAIKFPFFLLFSIMARLAQGIWNLIRSVGRRLYQALTISVFYASVAIIGVFVLYAVPIVFGLLLKIVNALS